MASSAIALQQLINVCHRYTSSIIVNLNVNALNSICFAFTLRLYKLCLPHVHINNVPLVFVDSIKYLGFTFSRNHKDDDDMFRQMWTL